MNKKIVKNYETERDYVFNWLLKHNHDYKEWYQIIKLKNSWLLKDKEQKHKGRPIRNYEVF